MKRSTTLALLATMILGVSIPATAQTTDDKAFTYSTLVQAKGQIRFAELAQERAQSEQVRSLAARVAQEWSSLQASLGNIAFLNAYPTPGAMNDEQLATLDRLGRTQPAAFDLTYLQVAQREYRLAIDRLQAERSTADSRLSAFAERTQAAFQSTKQVIDSTLGAM